MRGSGTPMPKEPTVVETDRGSARAALLVHRVVVRGAWSPEPNAAVVEQEREHAESDAARVRGMTRAARRAVCAEPRAPGPLTGVGADDRAGDRQRRYSVVTARPAATGQHQLRELRVARSRSLRTTRKAANPSSAASA